MSFASRMGRDLAIALVVLGSAVSLVRAETGILLANAQGGDEEPDLTGPDAKLVYAACRSSVTSGLA